MSGLAMLLCFVDGNEWVFECCDVHFPIWVNPVELSEHGWLYDTDKYLRSWF